MITGPGINVFYCSHDNFLQIAFSYLILLCLVADIVCEAHSIVRPSSSQSQNCGNPYSNETANVDNDFTLSQFIDNSSTNSTKLIFLPRNYSLESELVVENVHTFSMSAWPGSSSKAVISCGHNARFEFKNVSTVTVSGLEFVGCFENHMISVSQFQLENSGFFGNSQAIVNGTVLIIEESVASLDRVAFISAVENTEKYTHLKNEGPY